MSDAMIADKAEERQRAILEKPMRIPELGQDELDAKVRNLVMQIGEPLGYEPDDRPLTTYFALMARHPGLFRAQMETGIMFFTASALPHRERELAVLRTAWLCGAPYEWGEHVDISHRMGVTPEETDRVRTGPEAAGWSDRERSLLRAVDELLADKMVCDATWSQLAEHYDYQQLIEIPGLVGQYVGIAMIQNALRVPLSENNRGFAER